MPKIFGASFPMSRFRARIVATEASSRCRFTRQGSGVGCHFPLLEFQDAAGEKLSLAHELIAGKTYRVIVTTAAVYIAIRWATWFGSRVLFKTRHACVLLDVKPMFPICLVKNCKGHSSKA